MNKETVEKRKDLRIHLLINLYEHYFKNKDKSRYLRMKTEDIVADSETELAYTYLINKGFVKKQSSTSTTALIITVDGIDFVESHILN
ncbi:hypothetical protein ABE61_04190 [Lysinibacillus sphaericus]|uniref:hypothetical protein n=1 Tax=Lysinibacillus sphaericus TaxID=1421 RepID=UPI0018CE735C|nr:hypothetical protein [Lysinibacillus sphaericus]MBG9453299.1 hypothetical protein [Lysinibacillus sphaericus]MBG9477097.1 hypothetical protein [Lysinibacillus sphaericus]MBG9591179.1 hypothetical protein [Lysinibacillus sphaericus]MBG9592003.1 hypothetical protein [Lysinibacillus sphaericus]